MAYARMGLRPDSPSICPMPEGGPDSRKILCFYFIEYIYKLFHGDSA